MEAPEVDLSGLIDIHIHSSPDVRPRFADDIELARAAADAGMRAIMLKSHVTLTSDRASIAEKVVGGIRVFGGLALNIQVGGFNPAAVESALAMGAKQIWMPTLSATTQHRHDGKPGGLSIFTAEGRIRPEVCEILDLVRRANVILGTGHIETTEVVALVKLARSMGLRKILVTHPEFPIRRIPVEVQAEMVGQGVFFERCYCHDIGKPGIPAAQEIAARIRQVGIESTVLSTDFGQTYNPAPVEGMKAYLAALSRQGLSREELRGMAADNPAYLLDL